jgi:hypothetical protein
VENQKTNLHLAYTIEEKPEGGFIARSDDPGAESIEAATKVELFQKMRAKTAALLHKETPAEERPITATIVNIATKQKTVATDEVPVLTGETSTGVNIWKVMFFLLLAAFVAWIVLHR